MSTLVDWIQLFPKGTETAVSFTQAKPGPLPCPSGDIITPFSVFPPPAPGTTRAFRLKAVFFVENAAGRNQLKIRFQSQGQTTAEFTLGAATGVGASTFAFSDWYKPAKIESWIGAVTATFESGAPYNNSAGIYSLFLEAHDLPN